MIVFLINYKMKRHKDHFFLLLTKFLLTYN